MYPPVPPSFESASGNHLNEKEANYCKVYANRCDHQKLQRAIDNQSSISEAENSIEPRPSLSSSFRGKKSQSFPALSSTRKIHQRISMLLVPIMLKGK